MSIRKDYTADVLRLLEGLRREIEDKKCIAGFMFPVKKEDLVFNIEKIKASIPREMKDAAMTNRESERILEVVKTGDPEKAAVNLRFLMDAGLVTEPARVARLEAYLKA